MGAVFDRWASEPERRGRGSRYQAFWRDENGRQRSSEKKSPPLEKARIISRWCLPTVLGAPFVCSLYFFARAESPCLGGAGRGRWREVSRTGMGSLFSFIFASVYVLCHAAVPALVNGREQQGKRGQA